MHANKNAVGDNVAVDIYPFIRRYEDGRIERFVRSSFVPASADPAASGEVATRDVVVDHATGVLARLFLPSGAATTGSRLPVVLYIHGGCFCTDSAFSRTYHRYAASLAARAGALVVSVEYRLAPEHPIPAAYDDAWAALRWVATTASLSDPWISAHTDRRRVFLAGDSVGGNIAYHTAVRASRDDGNSVDVEGIIIVQPYLWGGERLPAEETWDGVAMFPPDLVEKLWPLVTAGQAGNDDPRIDPPDEEIASLKCRRALVALAGKDIFRHRARRLASRMRDGAWKGSVTLVELEGEDHCFHLYRPQRATSHKLMESIVQFINQPIRGISKI
ncbi:probable carboxylesterase 5 [Lolium rigidum]|uniref:probable carboxylesterase 5 n=1 Tax=Lolium rigidum TaxID=89674 RepID=UPI001F5C7A49|nr:probable carboxylesterase 5 [Lolium rigidum]